MVCKDVEGLFKAFNRSHCSDEWMLFIDSSKVSLKAILLHNGSVLPYIPVAHAFRIKESDDNMKQLLQYIKYDTYKWNICADLKVIALLLGLQLGYTKFPCFLYEWVAETKNITLPKGYGLSERFWSQDTKIQSIIHWLSHRRFCCHLFISN